MLTTSFSCSALGTIALLTLTAPGFSQRYDVKEPLFIGSTTTRGEAIVPSGRRISRIEIGYNSVGVLYNVRFGHHDYMRAEPREFTPWHSPSGSNGSTTSFDLQPREYLTRVGLRGTNLSVIFMKFTTNLGREFVAGTTVGTVRLRVVDLAGYEFVGFKGFVDVYNDDLAGVRPVK